MKDILETIILHLVDDKEAVNITEVANPEDEKDVTFEVKVAKNDMGRIIGKQGKVAKSIRTVMKSVAATDRKRVNIEFVDVD